MKTVENVFGGKVRVRVCGLCFDNDKILLVRHNMGKYHLWSPPGGGVEVGESMTEALKREFKEETGLIVNPGKLLFVHEHINDPYHAIEIYFEIASWQGPLRAGTETEITTTNILEAVKFISSTDLISLPHEELHSILRNCTNPRDILDKRGLIEY
jgi:8-oxo-dGTP diphosphatase